MSDATAAPGAPEALYLLLSWLSPAFPVGAFSYSHGLEQAVEAGTVADRDGARAWIGDVLAHGGGRTDAVFLLHAHALAAAEDSRFLGTINDLALAYAPSAERRLETGAQGSAFLKTVAEAWPSPAMDAIAAALPGEVAYPVAVGAAAGAHAIDADQASLAFLHAFVANLVSAAVRLVPLGQTDGQRITAALAPVVRAVAEEAADTSLSEVGGAAILADIASMRHETQYTRLFRS